jgi:hypothetical protein
MVQMARNWIVGLAMAAAATGASAYERMPAEQWTQPYAATLAKLPLCHDPRVLEKIQSRFASNEREYWNSLLTIVNFEQVKPTDFRPWGLDFIPRRFCIGTVWTSDHHKREVVYSVIEDTNVAGWSWGVEWCVRGLDRAWAYAPHCRAAGP